ncbi:hypothetical protein ACO1B2_05800 [Staphylococcus saprophyticus]|uniref:hypothetical protein n=1 Tax=Staphylococcus TaxID=1279 RepID=UPI0029798650|nr:hypothetical protein [Staphylococcus saprophyticus]
MNELIRLIKKAVANQDQQLHNVTREDYRNLNELEKRGYIVYKDFNNAPDIIVFEKGENYDQL